MYNRNYCFLTVVTCGAVLTEEDLQRLTEHDLLNDKVITGSYMWYIGTLVNAFIGNKSILEAGSLHCNNARKCMCYLVNYSNVYQDVIFYSLYYYQALSSWSSFRSLDMML